MQTLLHTISRAWMRSGWKTSLGFVFGWLLVAACNTATAQSESIRFVTFNVNFNNTNAQIRSDIRSLRSECDFMLLQEAKWVTVDDFLGNLWTVYQVVDSGDARRGSAIAVRNAAIKQILATGLELGVRSNGEDILDRYIAWMDVELNNSRRIRVMSIHMPPKRIEYLQPIMGDNLAAFVETSPYPVLVGGDWNFTVNLDKWGLRTKMGFISQGVNIDGFYYDPTGYTLTGIQALTSLNVNSDHDPVRMTALIGAPSSVYDWNLY